MTETPPHVLDDDIIEVPISAIEHYSYCPRQCALIHVEQTFDENVYTMRGSIAHERPDAGDTTATGSVTVLRSIPLWSERLRLRGRADVVELRGNIVYPVEYKIGRRKGPHADLQLCAQAMCLEEMLGTTIERGAIFSHAARRRYEVMFDATLRQRTEEIVVAIHRMLQDQHVPDAPNDSRCPKCSLVTSCMPRVVAERARLRGLQGTLFIPLSEPPDV